MFGERRFKRRKVRRSGRVLGHRRTKMRRIKLTVAVLFAVVLVVITAWLLRLERLMVSDVVTHGNDIVSTEDIKKIALEDISGTYFLVVPKKSVFFYPALRIKQDILNTFPRIDNVETDITDNTKLRIDVTERKPFALWCGETYVDTNEDLGNCYFIDEGSFIFATAPDFTGNVFFKYFGPLAETSPDSIAPIGGTFMVTTEFQGLQLFLEGFKGFGYDPVSLARRDERDFELELADGAKIIFGGDQSLNILLDNLQSVVDSEAFQASASKKLEYIDLRFGNRVYYKFIGEGEAGG